MGKNKNPQTQGSALGCIFSMLWVLCSLPIWVGAFVLLAAGSSLEGKLFAFAVLCLLPLPLNFRHWHRKGRRVSTALLLLAGLAALIACASRAPRAQDHPEARARLLYRNDTTHRRFSPANMVPELDQHILGSYLFALVDPHLDWDQAAHLRELLKTIYQEKDKDPELAALPSTLGFTYQDVLLGRRQIGNLFAYLPDGDAPKPVILFLHGSLGNFQGYWQIWKSFADEHGFAIVAPTFGAGNWHEEGGLDAIADAQRFCLVHPRLDEKRIILAGISSGAMGVTRAAKATPQDWKGLLLLSPVMENSVVDIREFADAWGARPVLLISGEKDERIPLAQLRGTEAAMVERGAAVESHYLPGEDHFLAYSSWPVLEKLIAQWIVSQGLD